MIKELTYIAGIAIDGITTYANFRTIRESINNSKLWIEKDMLVDNLWLDQAINNGILDKGEYSWKAENSLPTLELQGVHSLVVIYNKEKKTMYRITLSNSQDRFKVFLMVKL
jgi:hypothetical protein